VAGQCLDGFNHQNVLFGLRQEDISDRQLEWNAASASGTGVSRTRHMAQRPIDAKAAERCASIVGAKQRGDEPPPSHVSVTDVALSSFPQNATLAVNDRDGDPGADDPCRQKSPAACGVRTQGLDVFRRVRMSISSLRARGCGLAG